MRFKVLIAALVMAILAVIAPTVPAQADASCAPGRICMWDLPNYGGEMVSLIPPPPSSGICMNVPNWFNDRATSFYPNTSLGFVFFDEPQCKIHLGTAVPWTPVANTVHNNIISSFRTF